MLPDVEASRFLKACRRRLVLSNVGLLPEAGRNRDELQREEVAQLAGISAEYYARIERGYLRDVSSDILNAVADALRLDDTQRAHLLRLSWAMLVDRPIPAPTIAPGLAELISQIKGVAVIAHNNALDVLAANPLAKALFAPLMDFDAPTNIPFSCFLNPEAPNLWLNWDQVADGMASALRTGLGVNRHDQRLLDVIAKLRADSAEFAKRWENAEVWPIEQVDNVLNHPLAGIISLSPVPFEVPGSGPVVLMAVEPGSSSARNMQQLAQIVSDESVAVSADGGVNSE